MEFMNRVDSSQPWNEIDVISKTAGDTSLRFLVLLLGPADTSVTALIWLLDVSESRCASTEV